jgi:hypothetical protein
MVKIISMGRRCVTDFFLEKYKLRNFSGPFSYLLVDFEVAINEINTNFKNYFKDIKKVENHNIKYLPHWRMTSTFYYNNYYLKLDIKKDIYSQTNMLIWNHHNILKEKETFKRRINRVLDFLKNDKCILFYIDKIYTKNNIDEYIKYLNNFIKNNFKFNHKILFIIPFDNNHYNNFNCKKYYNNDILYIYLIKVTKISDLEKQTKIQNITDTKTPLLDVDIHDKNINWNLLYQNIKHFFN